MGRFKDQFDQIIEDFTPNQKEWCIHDYLRVGANVLELGATMARQYGGDDSSFEELVFDAEAVWRERIIPIKLHELLPLLPESVETGFLDPLSLQLVRPALEKFRPKDHEDH